MSDNGTVIVTGASRGIGAAIAVLLMEAGYTVACLSRKGEAPQGMTESLMNRCQTLCCDVTNRENLENVFRQLGERGAIVGLVNNAGLHLHGRSESFPLDQYELVLRTNATATFLACQQAYSYLVASGGGLIVNIGSLSDKLGSKYSVAYCASKAAVGAITRCLAVEWAKDNIQVLDVAPGYIQTGLTASALDGPLGMRLAKRIPTGGPGSPNDVAKLVTALFSSSIPYLSGTTIYIDGGQGIAD